MDETTLVKRALEFAYEPIDRKNCSAVYKKYGLAPPVFELAVKRDNITGISTLRGPTRKLNPAQAIELKDWFAHRLKTLIDFKNGGESALICEDPERALGLVIQTTDSRGRIPVNLFIQCAWALLIDTSRPFQSRVWNCKICGSVFLSNTRHRRTTCNLDSCKKKAHSEVVAEGRKQSKK